MNNPLGVPRECGVGIRTSRHELADVNSRMPRGSCSIDPSTFNLVEVPSAFAKILPFVGTSNLTLNNHVCSPTVLGRIERCD
jgi:hypothetical protein